MIPFASHQSVVERALVAARSRFFASGFDAAFFSRSASDANLGEADLARHFGDARGLLRAVIEQEADQLRSGLPLLPQTAAEYWQALITYGTNVLELLNRPDVIALDRLVHEQARGDSALGTLFYDSTYGRSLQEIAEILEHGQAAGFVRDPAPAAELAEALLAAWEGLVFTRARLGATDRPYPDPARRSAMCVHLLFRGQVW